MSDCKQFRNFKNVKLNLLFNYDQWKNFEDLKFILNKITLQTLDHLNFFNFFSYGEITFNLSADDELKKLNEDFFQKDYPTNVLSFPYHTLYEGEFSALPANTKSCYLGDIAINYNKLQTESLEQNKTFKSHLTHLTIHSILHLCGYDHIEDTQAEKMEKLELELLKIFNIDNPYIID